MPDLHQDFSHFCDIGFTTEMAEVFQEMKAYTLMLDAYQEGSLINPDLCMMSHQRNFVQYSIMALPSASELGEAFTKSHPAYESFRISAIIFGVGVIFPLPPVSAPLARLTRLLQHELERHMPIWELWSPDALGILIWVLILGGSAATGMPERTWYVAKLGGVISQCGLVRWHHAKQLVKQVIWLDCACDSVARQLWKDAVSL